MASAGMRISEKTITPSTPSRRKGCKETSVANSGVLQTSRNPCFARISRYSGRYRPACRIIQTGRRGTVSPRQARRDRKSTRLNSSHSQISYAVFCLKKKNYNSEVNLSALDGMAETVLTLLPYDDEYRLRIRRTVLVQRHDGPVALAAAGVHDRVDDV